MILTVHISTLNLSIFDLGMRQREKSTKDTNSLCVCVQVDHEQPRDGVWCRAEELPPAWLWGQLPTHVMPLQGELKITVLITISIV